MREHWPYLPGVLVAASSAAVLAGGLAYWAAQHAAVATAGTNPTDATAPGAAPPLAQPVLHGRISTRSSAAACKPPTGGQPGAKAGGDAEQNTPVRVPRAVPGAAAGTPAGMSPATPEAAAEQRVSQQQQPSPPPAATRAVSKPAARAAGKAAADAASSQSQAAADRAAPARAHSGELPPLPPPMSLPAAVEAQGEQLQQQSAPQEQLNERRQQQEPHQLRLHSSATTSSAAAVAAPLAAAPTSPASSSGDGDSSSRPSLARQHRCFNTAVQAPSLDASVSTAAVARSLGLQYAAMGSGNLTAALGSEDDSGPHADADSSSVASSGDEEGGQAAASLASTCAALCVKHCTLLQQATSAETMALDIGCGTGGCCFELALSFTHVLGIDSDPLNVVAAKEMKAKGELRFTPVSTSAAADDGAGSATQEELATCVVRVPDAVDRDRVLFWTFALPDLPPKMSLVEAVLVEDVEGRLGAGLQRVCEQLRGLLKPGGVCVAVLGPDAAAGSQVAEWLANAGLVHVADEDVTFPAPSHAGSVRLQAAKGSVWRQL